MNDSFLEFITTGKYLPAVGVALIAIVSLARAGLATRWPWFAGQIGGYVLGYGAAAALYVGAALRDGAGLSLGLFGAALAAGWAAAGGFEHFRDVLTSLRKVPPAPPRAVVVSMAMLISLVVGCSSCKTIADSKPGSAIIDCTVANMAQLDALKKDLAVLLQGTPDWSAILQHAKGAGVTIGGCVLAELVQSYLGGRKAVTSDESWSARRALEEFRSEMAGGATFKTSAGNL